MKNVCFLFTVLFFMISCTQKTPLEKVLTSDSKIIQNVIQNAEDYEVQIIYSQINRNEKGIPSFIDYTFNLAEDVYFYPASSVKFPIALMSLQKLKELQKKGVQIDRKTSFITKKDTLHTSIEKEIIKIFAVSNNQAYNRLFEFLGQDYINQNLDSKKLTGRISHRLSAFHSHNLTTQSILFHKNNDTLYKQESIENSPHEELSLKKLLKGQGYIYNYDLIEQPKDFSKKNYLPLRSLHEMMKRVQFSELYQIPESFDLNDNDREFLLNAMRMLPREAGYAKTKYNDGYGKFFIFGDRKDDIPQHIKIYNKVGYAYGYITDSAYIQDTKNDIEFILSATIHVNKNGIYNDDTYEYNEIGIPFLAELGRRIYALEKGRKK